MRLRLLNTNREPTSLLGWLMVLACLLLPMAVTGCGDPVGAISSPGTVAASDPFHPPAATPAGPVAAVTDKVIVEGARALIFANLAYQTVGTAAAVGIEQGWITGDTKLKVQAASQRASDALETGQRAVLKADKAASAVRALAAIDALCGLHPKLAIACKAVR